jgi:hypothetical protein
LSTILARLFLLDLDSEDFVLVKSTIADSRLEKASEVGRWEHPVLWEASGDIVSSLERIGGDRAKKRR